MRGLWRGGEGVKVGDRTGSWNETRSTLGGMNRNGKGETKRWKR